MCLRACVCAGGAECAVSCFLGFFCQGSFSFFCVLFSAECFLEGLNNCVVLSIFFPVFLLFPRSLYLFICLSLLSSSISFTHTHTNLSNICLVLPFPSLYQSTYLSIFIFPPPFPSPTNTQTHKRISHSSFSSLSLSLSINLLLYLQFQVSFTALSYSLFLNSPPALSQSPYSHFPNSFAVSAPLTPSSPAPSSPY